MHRLVYLILQTHWNLLQSSVGIILRNKILRIHSEHIDELESGIKIRVIDFRIRNPFPISLEVVDKGWENGLEAIEEGSLFRSGRGWEVHGNSWKFLTNYDPEHLQESGKVDMEEGCVEHI